MGLCTLHLYIDARSGFQLGRNRIMHIVLPVLRESAKCRYVCTSVRSSECNKSTLTEQIFVKFDMSIFRKSVNKIPVSLRSGKNKGTLHEDKYTFFITSCSILLRTRNFSDKSCRENQNTHFVFSDFFSKIYSENTNLVKI